MYAQKEYQAIIKEMGSTPPVSVDGEPQAKCSKPSQDRGGKPKALSTSKGKDKACADEELSIPIHKRLFTLHFTIYRLHHVMKRI